MEKQWKKINLSPIRGATKQQKKDSYEFSKVLRILLKTS
jgi:hypothetical protein